jgi:MFS family permease
LIVGALIAGQTADRIGRKRTIQLGALIAVIGELPELISSEVANLQVAPSRQLLYTLPCSLLVDSSPVSLSVCSR